MIFAVSAELYFYFCEYFFELGGDSIIYPPAFHSSIEPQTELTDSEVGIFKYQLNMTRRADTSWDTKNLRSCFCRQALPPDKLSPVVCCLADDWTHPELVLA